MPSSRVNTDLGDCPKSCASAELGGDIGKGWWPLVRELEDVLDRIAPGWTPIQVKEKFGVLRFYADPPESEAQLESIDLGGGKSLSIRSSTPHSNVEFTQAIEEAEARSASICEFCGDPGNTQNLSGWRKTVCNRCTQSRTRAA